ncbi:hypothetical protein BH747_08980 [Enterococcus villorum]|uniref:HTH cro/C1-type domain-containing protein n=1 Tax=Enterococcus villorum TaxID=112904 RepID=A0A1V8YBT2_9ENTE|nr:Rgg/GadR/MutR family transcriptional regulator [Enterococcus villorum]OQO70032.1 hypothetical protein BH747_08980 [Enterococcus villorum]OQO71934.1 hypothetical protein BH744_12705 [Enterococcus villorum]
MRTSGEVIREMRTARNLSLQFLANGIMSREALNKFELRNTSISSDKLFTILSRMNVSVEEYLIQLEANYYIEKKQIEKNFIEVLNKKKDSTLFINELKHKFTLSNDPYYYLKYCQFSLELAVKNQSSLTDLKNEIEAIKSYLNRIEHWGIFELTIFSNCLFVFDIDYILIVLNRIKNKVTSYTEHTPDLKKKLYYFYLNCLILFTKKNRLDLFPVVLPLVKQLSEDPSYMYYRISFNIFEKIYIEQAQFSLESIKKELDILDYLGYSQLGEDIRDTLTDVSSFIYEPNEKNQLEK